MTKIHGHCPHVNGKRTPSPTYYSWQCMITRCNNPNFAQYKDYGGRGVKVCARWDPKQGGSFANFLEDMGERPDGTQLDKDLKPGCLEYSRETCQWVENKRANRHRRSSHFITHNGETKCLKDWTEHFGCDYQRTIQRMRRGWSFERAIAV